MGAESPHQSSSRISSAGRGGRAATALALLWLLRLVAELVLHEARLHGHRAHAMLHVLKFCVRVCAIDHALRVLHHNALALPSLSRRAGRLLPVRRSELGLHREVWRHRRLELALHGKLPRHEELLLPEVV